MLKDNPEDFLSDDLEYMNVSLISSKIRVLIVGGGRAGFIKSRSFIKRGCDVTVIAKSFCQDLMEIGGAAKLKLIDASYSTEYVLDKHLIVIAIDDMEVREAIINDCNKYCKLYLNCTDFREGCFVIPSQGNTDNINFSINSNGGSPKTSAFLIKVMEEKLIEYDEFVRYNIELRKRLKNSINKNEILSFIANEDFFFFMEKGAHHKVLNMFYGGKNYELKDSNQT